MSSIFDVLDLSDPCAVAPVLEKAYLQLLAGEAVARARFGEDDITFSPSSLNALEAKVRELKAACEAKKAGGTVRRRAFRGGFAG